MIFKIHYEKLGGHTHCALFSAKQSNMTYAKCGEFCIRNEELEDLKYAMAGVSFRQTEGGSE